MRAARGPHGDLWNDCTRRGREHVLRIRLRVRRPNGDIAVYHRCLRCPVDILRVLPAAQRVPVPAPA